MDSSVAECPKAQTYIRTLAGELLHARLGNYIKNIKVIPLCNACGRPTVGDMYGFLYYKTNPYRAHALHVYIYI